MRNFSFKGRLGVEAVGNIAGCCISTLTKWRPRYLGESRKCWSCGTTLKTVGADDYDTREFTGMMNEVHKEGPHNSPVLAALWFFKEKFPEKEDVLFWLKDRDLPAHANHVDDMAWCSTIKEVLPDTEHYLWCAPGVMAVVGLAKMDTGGMASGGMMNPTQGGYPEDENEDEFSDEEDESVESVLEEEKGCEEKASVMANFEKSLKVIIEKSTKGI